MNQLEKILTTVKLREDLKIFLDLIINNFEVDECWRYYKKLSEMQKSLSPEANKIFQEELSEIIIKLKWIAFQRLGDGDILELLGNHLLIIKDLSLKLINLREEIRGFLVGIINYEDRDVLKLKIREVLLKNQEILDIQAPVKTIGDWLRNISVQVGQGIADNLRENEYYIKDNNFIRLKQEDQEFLKNIIKVYKYCWFSSQTAEGLDEAIDIINEDSNLKVLEFGQLIDVPPLDPDTVKIIDLFTASSGGAQPQPAVKEDDAGRKIKEIETIYKEKLAGIQKKYNINQGILKHQAKTVSELVKFLEDPLLKREELLSVLSLLIDKDKDLKFLERSKSVTASSALDIKNVVKNLLTRVGLTEEESAVFASYLAGINRKFMGMSYLDVKTKTFKWR